MAKTTTKKFSGIELEINQAPDTEFVPSGHKYVDQKKLLETVAFGIKENLPVLLIGETGTGKTSAIRYLAQETNNAFRRLNLNGSTSVDEFVGKILIDETGTYWTDGILVDAMRKGHWLLVDEINAGLPEILFVLQSLLDDDRYVLLSDKKDREVVRPHENFRIFATCNPSDNYSGTKEMNKALLSRFPLVLEVGFPEASKELDIMKTKFKDINEDLVNRMIGFANSQRQAYETGKVDFCFSTRELVNWYKVQQFTGGNVRLAAEYTILSKCNAQDRKVLKDVIDISFAEIETTYAGPYKKGVVITTKKDITPYQMREVVPAGTKFEILSHPVDRGGNIGFAVSVKVITWGKHDPLVTKVPIRTTFAIKVDDLETN